MRFTCPACTRSTFPENRLAYLGDWDRRCVEYGLRKAAGRLWHRETRIGHALVVSTTELPPAIDPGGDEWEHGGAGGYESALIVHGRFDRVLLRYPTREGAKAYHDVLCMGVRRKLAPYRDPEPVGRHKSAGHPWRSARGGCGRQRANP